MGGGGHKFTTKCPVESSFNTKVTLSENQRGKEVKHEELEKGISNRGNSKNRAQRRLQGDAGAARRPVKLKRECGAKETVRKVTGGQVIHDFMKTVEMGTFTLSETGNWGVTRFDLHLNKPPWLICEAMQGTNRELAKYPWYEMMDGSFDRWQWGLETR